MRVLTPRTMDWPGIPEELPDELKTYFRQCQVVMDNLVTSVHYDISGGNVSFKISSSTLTVDDLNEGELFLYDDGVSIRRLYARLNGVLRYKAWKYTEEEGEEEGTIWTTKADFESGTLDKVYVPSGLGQLELEYGELSGTGEWIHDAGSGKTANWMLFKHSKQNAKTIWRDDFRADSISKYTLHNMPGWNDGAGVAPGYDGANKRLIINTGDDNGTTLEIPGLSVQNVKASIDVYITGQYPTNAAVVQFLRYINSDNDYFAPHQAAGASVPSAISKWVSGVHSDLVTPGGYFPKSTRRWLKFEINGSSLKSYTDEYSHSATDSSFPNAGKVLMGCWQSIGYVYSLLVEHYSVPSPVQCTVTFRFATSDNNVDWSAWETDIADCADSRYIKIKATFSRTDLGNSAMPVLEDMTVEYLL